MKQSALPFSSILMPGPNGWRTDADGHPKFYDSKSKPVLAHAPFGIVRAGFVSQPLELGATRVATVPSCLKDLGAFVGGSQPTTPPTADSIKESAARRYAEIEAATGIKEISALSQKQLENLYRATILNRVARVDQIAKYDPTGVLGFCYGRAMAAQLTARQMGLSRDSISKLFIVGDLRSEGEKPEWRFHVTTIVRGPANQWYAIDPIMHAGGPYQPLTVDQWIKTVRAGWDEWHGDKPRAKLYLAPPNTIIPDVRFVPELEDGSRIIELNFNPEQHGIHADPETLTKLGLKINSEVVFEMDPNQAQRFFQTTDEGDEGQFDFIEVRINDEIIPYRGYFVDLLDTFRSGSGSFAVPAQSLRPRSLSPTRAAQGPQAFGSFDLSRLRKGTP